jgi:hypothetical protein
MAVVGERHRAGARCFASHPCSLPAMKRSLFSLLLAVGIFVDASHAAAPKSLGRALTHHVSFNTSLDADFSRGDKTAYANVGKATSAFKGSGEIKIAPADGKFGGALHITKKNPVRPYFKGPGVLDYKSSDWSGSVSVWLRLSPDEDLEPGYCDPVQIVGGDSKKGFMFLEWSKDETPRYFRYAIRPLVEIWNPQNKDWGKMTNTERPMIQVERAPFSREKWTHVVFTFDRLNTGKTGQGKLYIDGKLQGAIQGWDLTLGWDPQNVQLVLGASYVGRMDDLAVFNRSLTDAEVKQVFGLKNGIKDLR